MFGFQHLRGCLVCLENIWNFKCFGRVGKVINDDKLALYGAQLNTYLEWFVIEIKFSADSLVPSAGARRYAPRPSLGATLRAAG